MNEQSVLFLTRSLDVGGAERQIVTLARGLKSRGVDVAVATFYGHGALLAELRLAGVPHFNLDKKGRWDLFGFVLRLSSLLRRHKPAVLYSFLTTSNLVAVLASLLVPSIRVVWGVRASKIDARRYGRLVVLEESAVRWFSWRPEIVIFNSEAGKKHYDNLGISCGASHVVNNGIDTVRFKFSADARAVFRESLGISEDTPLVGIVARLDPMKGHEDFFRMALLILRSRPDARFLCVGSGPEDLTRYVRTLPAAVELAQHLFWRDEQRDLQPVYSSIDVLVSSSFSEAFSNVIAEAMACERLCVVTDVGDSARIVGECGIVVPPRDPAAAASACEKILGLTPAEKRSRGAECRHRVIECFGIERFIDETMNVLGLRGLRQ